MTDFLIWYFNLTAMQAVEFLFKALLLMFLFSLPVLVAYLVFRHFARAENAPTVRQHHELRELRELDA